VALRIPDRLREKILKIDSLSDDITAQLIDALSGDTPKVTSDEFPAEVAKRITGISAQDATEILEALISLYMLRSTAQKSAHDITSDLVEAIKNTPRGAGEGVRDSESLRSRLEKLLSNRALEAATKAVSVITEHQAVYRSARIFTDVRSIFSDDIAKPPIAAVIVHNLKLSYSESGTRKEFFLALDTDDVQKLIDVLERAKKKDATVRKLLADAKLPHIDT